MSQTRLRIALRSLRWLPGLLAYGPTSRRTTADCIERVASRRPTGVFVRFEGRTLSYAEFNARANRVAHWALEQGLGRGDVVALLMESRPEYLETWAGLAKAGATTALLNTNLSGAALAHALGESRCRALVLGAECAEAWASLGAQRPTGLPVFALADAGVSELPAGAESLEAALAGHSRANPPRSVRAALRGGDPLFYIYTSGTTGLPKAARFSHARFMGGGLYALLSGFGPGDTLYCPLPLYHTVGGVMCVNAVLRAGATLALGRRFSASAFWKDVVETGASAFQYVGETCRYLLARPPEHWEREHRVRLCVGNGLRPDIWRAFQERFRIPQITEFYGATESNVTLVNLEGRVGSVGRPAPGTKLALIRYDVTRDAHPRDSAGRCIPCGVGEPGELVGRISHGRTAAGRFEGYTSAEASERKVLRDAFQPGDAWFRTGDLLRRDADGFYYFVDRIGDTFRWKGENVSTQEVSEALATVPGVLLCAVYGVELPGADGRAGMAALVLQQGASLDGDALYRHAREKLPAYARPAFVRLQREPDLTGTFKIRKLELQRQGFDPESVSEPLYYRDDERRAYLPLTPAVHARVRAGGLRF
jgi:fatty-acyl-CoA synthase